MLGRVFGFLRGKGLIVEGAGKLPEGEARKVDVGDVLAGGKQVILCRVKGKLHALDSVCPHEGGRITPGPLVEGKYALCPLHNYRFDPATGENVEHLCGRAKTYRVEERDGDAELWV
ncbi:MAG: Rieske (2Fe-2S) protein [Planctomycetes bacterium]|nr:Rieske (2Fe-2S) protein [Planctomycetota bacterium]